MSSQHPSSPQQPQPQGPSAEQVYQRFNQNELNSRQMFETIYNSYLSMEQEYKKLQGTNSQLIEQITQLSKTKKLEEPTNKKNGKK